MIQGHIETLEYGSKNSATVQDSICAVAINFNVSHEIILRNQKRHVTNLTFIIYRWRCNQISLWNILNQNYISSSSFTVLIPRLCILYWRNLCHVQSYKSNQCDCGICKRTETETKRRSPQTLFGNQPIFFNFQTK